MKFAALDETDIMFRKILQKMVVFFAKYDGRFYNKHTLGQRSCLTVEYRRGEADRERRGLLIAVIVDRNVQLNGGGGESRASEFDGCV